MGEAKYEPLAERMMRVEVIQDAHTRELREFKDVHRREMTEFREAVKAQGVRADAQGDALIKQTDRLNRHLSKMEGVIIALVAIAGICGFLVTLKTLGVFDAVYFAGPALGPLPIQP